MSLQTKLFAWLGSVAMVFALFFSVFQYGRHIEGLERDNEMLVERLVYAKAFEDAQTANDKLKSDGAKQHAKDTAITERERANFAAFRLHLPKATACDGDTNTASGGMDGGAGGWIRPDPEQEAADRLSDGLKQDSYRIDTVLDSCRVVMTWARNLCKLNNTCMEAK